MLRLGGLEAGITSPEDLFSLESPNEIEELIEQSREIKRFMGYTDEQIQSQEHGRKLAQESRSDRYRLETSGEENYRYRPNYPLDSSGNILLEDPEQDYQEADVDGDTYYIDEGSR